MHAGENIGGTGNALVNAITGNSGANTLNGGLGNDVLKGGAGKDIFLFNTKRCSKAFPFFICNCNFTCFSSTILRLIHSYSFCKLTLLVSS